MLRTEPNLNFTVDGNDYSDEIIAEYMDLAATRKTYWTVIPGLLGARNSEDDTPVYRDRDFFAVYAARQCKALIGTDAYLQERLKVNTALSSMQAFANAFNCKENDPMYSSDNEKCKWLEENDI